MSRKPKNNHYHYAEYFADRARKARRRGFVLPKRFLFLAAVLVLLFSVVTVTFSYTETPDDTSSGGSIMIKVRNSKSSRDDAVTGRSVDNADTDSRMNEGLADVGANVELAQTAATTYYYRGGKNSWGATAMTASSDGFYSYYSATGGAHQFKISTSTTSYDYNYTYVSSGFNSTNVTDIGDYSQDNCYCWTSSAHYIIIYYPSTVINSSNSPKICASTTLPDNSLQVSLGEFFTNQNTTTEHLMTNSSGTWSYTMSLTGNTTRDFYFHINYKNHTGDDKYYKDQNEATMTYDHCENWQFETNNKGNPKLATIITGNYTFKFVYSTKKVTVTYPKYSISASRTPTAAANAPTVGTSSVAIGSSVTLTAKTANTGYEFVKWEITAGSATTGSYGGTAFSSSTNTSITVYPTGTTQAVTFRAVYKIAEYPITYKTDATPATATGAITNPATNSVPTSDTKQYNVAYTITSNTYTRQGYTQVGWSTTANRANMSGTGYYAFGAPYSTNAALTLYPVWELNTPTASIDSTGSMTVGSTPADLNLTESTVYDDVTRSYSYSITGPSGSTASVGTDPSDTDNFMMFTADTPGTYTVTITITDVSSTNVTNASNTATVTTNSATISVSPDAPVFSITAYNVIDHNGTTVLDGSTPALAYMILLGERYYFSAEIDSTYLANHPVSSYSYEWSTDASFASQYIVGTGTSITFIDDGSDNYQTITYDPNHTYDPENNDPDPRSVQDESDGGLSHNVQLYCRVTRNNVSKDSMVKRLYYYIQPLLKSFEYDPFQKIFNMNDQTVSLAAEYNIANDTRFTTDLFFSNNNFNYASALDQPAQGFIQSFTNAIKAYLYPAGPKFFYITMTGPNAEGNTITSSSDTIHTTVGTADSTANRALYFDNNVTNMSLKNYQVLCYYIDGNGRLKYQVAQDLYTYDDDKNDESTYDNNGQHYRVMIPSNATAVRFGFLAEDRKGIRYYGTPSISNGTITGFSDPIYYGYTNQISLTATVNKITASSSAAYGMLQVFTCTAGTY